MTFVEVIISVVILTMITGALSTAFVSSLRTSKVTTERIHQSNDQQIIAGYFTRDAQAAGGSNPATGTVNPSLGVSLTDPAGCIATGTFVVRFAWIDLSTGSTHVAIYSTLPVTGTPGVSQLARTTCVTPGGGATDRRPLRKYSQRGSTRSRPTRPSAWCDNSQAAPSCPVTPAPTTVSMRITESDTPGVTNGSPVQVHAHREHPTDEPDRAGRDHAGTAAAARPEHVQRRRQHDRSQCAGHDRLDGARLRLVVHQRDRRRRRRRVPCDEHRERRQVPRRSCIDPHRRALRADRRVRSARLRSS